MKNFQFTAATLLILAGLFITTSCEKEENFSLQQTYNAENWDADIIGSTSPQTSNNIGDRKSYIELTKQWWKYVMSFDCSKNPLNFPGLTTTAYQPGSFVFLVGASEGFFTRNVVVARNQSILVPVINKLSNYPCTDLSTRPPTGSSLEQLLLSEPDKFIDLVTNIKVSLDDKPVNITNNNRLTTGLFSFTGKADLTQCLDICVTGQLQPAVSDGYWLVLSRLPAGKHVLRIHAEILHTGIVIDGIYNIIVR